MVKQANADIVNAWAQCEAQAGFKCWAIQPGNSHDVVLKMIINRPYQPFKAPRIRNIAHSDNVVVAAGQKVSDIEVASMNPRTVLFKRVGPDADMPVTFSITTSDANYSGDCEVIGLPTSRVELLTPIFDPQRTGYALLDPQTGLVTVAPGTARSSPCNVGFKIVMEEGGKYTLVVEYATEESRPCDVLLNAYDAQGQPVYPDYLTFVKNLASAVTIVGALAQPTGGFGPAYLRSTTVGELELRKGLNTIHIRRRSAGEPGYRGSGYIPDIGGIKLVRQISLKPLPETHTAWLQLNGKETVLENSVLAG